MTTVHKGLAGVVADQTAVSKVNPETNSLLYRGYPVQELAASLSFEEVAWLLWTGERPTADELSTWVATERSLRAIPDNVRAVMDQLPAHAHPMDIVRTAVSAMGASDKNVADSSVESMLAQSKQLFAVLPAIVSRIQRLRNGLPEIAPRDDVDYCENFLWMSFGEIPDPVIVDAFRVSMVLYAEHSFNASTFTARVITSTMSDLYSAITGAIGALKGPLHGGANEAVLEIFDEIGMGEGSALRAAEWLDTALAEKKKIMGFGHRVYKNGDSRVPTMRDALTRVVAHVNRPDVMDLYDALEEAMTTRKGILPNLDFPSGPCYHLMGYDTAVFTPLFVASRITGWTAHVIEQSSNNSLIRPLSEYVGVEQRSL
jgi:2-methylcitrate synthase/citrate synthase II